MAVWRLFLRLLPVVFLVGQVCAAPYLEYQEPQQPQTPFFSTWSSVFSLLATFFVVLALAYLTSRLVANKLKWSAESGGKIISCLSFGAGRGVYLVEFAGRYWILGVTEHNINLLKELSDDGEIEKFKESPVNLNESFDFIFKRQLSSLQQISQKIPAVFGRKNNNDYSKQEDSGQNSRLAERDDREKR